MCIIFPSLFGSSLLHMTWSNSRPEQWYQATKMWRKERMSSSSGGNKVTCIWWASKIQETCLNYLKRLVSLDRPSISLTTLQTPAYGWCCSEVPSVTSDCLQVQKNRTHAYKDRKEKCRSPVKNIRARRQKDNSRVTPVKTWGRELLFSEANGQSRDWYETHQQSHCEALFMTERGFLPSSAKEGIADVRRFTKASKFRKKIWRITSGLMFGQVQLHFTYIGSVLLIKQNHLIRLDRHKVAYGARRAKECSRDAQLKGTKISLLWYPKSDYSRCECCDSRQTQTKRNGALTFTSNFFWGLLNKSVRRSVRRYRKINNSGHLIQQFVNERVSFLHIKSQILLVVYAIRHSNGLTSKF